jgi:hypothetical protein
MWTEKWLETVSGIARRIARRDHQVDLEPRPSAQKSVGSAGDGTEESRVSVAEPPILVSEIAQMRSTAGALTGSWRASPPRRAAACENPDANCTSSNNGFASLGIVVVRW